MRSLPYPALCLCARAAAAAEIRACPPVALSQDVGEKEALLPHLVEMFGVHGENAPPWDTQKRYASPNLHVYAPFLSDVRNDGGTGEREVVSRLRPDTPLIGQLQRLQTKGYGIPGVPVLHVVVKGSDYEKRFFLNRLAV